MKNKEIVRRVAVLVLWALAIMGTGGGLVGAISLEAHWFAYVVLLANAIVVSSWCSLMILRDFGGRTNIRIGDVVKFAAKGDEEKTYLIADVVSENLFELINEESR